MRHAARLEHVQPAAVTAADLLVRQYDPRIHERRDVLSVRSPAFGAGVRLASIAVTFSVFR